MSRLFDLVDVATFWSILLIVHGLLAVALLGAITHQAAAVVAATRRTAPSSGVLARFARVRGDSYTGAVCLLWVLSYLLGGWIYSKYRIAVRIPLEQEGFWKTQGVFELKEHLASVGLMLLPLYWLLWRRTPAERHRAARRWTTLLLAAMVWYFFLVGHIVNNVRGFGS